MSLTRDLLLPFPGLNGHDGLCHVRIYERPGVMPVVVVGALDDNPGTSITNAAESVAEAIATTCIADGREFRYIEHWPDRITGEPTPTFAEVTFKHRTPTQRTAPDDHLGRVVVLDDQGAKTVALGPALRGDFRDPQWRHVDDLPELIPDADVRVWPPGSYTAVAVGGRDGDRLRSELSARARAAAKRFRALVEQYTQAHDTP